jgi:restriction endonuclease S subunit
MSEKRNAERISSSFDWLGEIPDNWPLKKLKYLANLVSEKVSEITNPVSYVGLDCIESWTGKRTTGNIDEFSPEGGGNRFMAGDVLFGKLRPYLAKVLLATNNGTCTSELLVLRGKKIKPSFLQYFLLSEPFIRIVDSSTYGSKMPSPTLAEKLFCWQDGRLGAMLDRFFDGSA